MSRWTATGLLLVGASAGSGKTHRLTVEVTSAVDPGRDDAIDVSSLVAVTYTRKAAAELGARIRRSLTEKGAFERAQRLPLGYVGTVHAVCLRLLQEHAIDAGLSPEVDVLPGEEALLLKEALDASLDPALRRRLDTLARSLELRLDTRSGLADWLLPVADVMTLARANRISPAALPAMAERSVGRLLELLGPAERSGERLERDLSAALEIAACRLDSVDDGVDKTESARELIREARRKLDRGELPWSGWVRLHKIEPAKRVADMVAELKEAAARVGAHPRLQAELREVTTLVFEAARQGLEGYAAWKAKRRAVDYVDMVDRTLSLLEDEEVAATLAERLRLCVVDEFQDTSPLQLAVFTRLHHISGRSVWVGDRKQCIFEYAGADPALMDSVARWVVESGGQTAQIEQNRRSRPELVEACSELFAAAFARHDYRRDEVVVEPHRKRRRELERLPPFGLWLLETAKAERDADAIAEGVLRLLEHPAETPVVDRLTDAGRELRPEDIAVLVATNNEAAGLAESLARRGIRAAIARTGLLATPEGTLIDAALRLLVDRFDGLSVAILDALSGYEGAEPEAWLDALIEVETLRRDARARDEEAERREPKGLAVHLETLRADIEVLAPTEALDRVLAALDLVTICARWPEPVQRLANLDALRALAADYEERSRQGSEAATVAGLVRFFAAAAEKRLVRDEERAADAQHVASGGAVQICTYHKAKGLEWPVVVLASLNRSRRRVAFEVSPETSHEAFDASHPLAGRWIRYWPWPFGPQKDCPLADEAERSPEGQAVAAREERERVRLLYVGFTRARDHLVLAARTGKKGPLVGWLDELCDAGGESLLMLPSDDSELVVRRPGKKRLSVAARTWRLDAGDDPPRRLGKPDAPRWFARPAASEPARLPYRIAPSRAESDWPELVARATPAPVETVVLGPRLPLGAAKGIDWDVVGSALHAFLAADVHALSSSQRRGRAERLIHAAKLGALLVPDALVAASDQLRRWVGERFPGARWRRELPICAAIATPAGLRRIEGTIDLLLETDRGAILVDHKSWPGGSATWADKAKEHAPQLAAYAQALRLAGQPVAESWIHFTVGGSAVRLR